MSRVDTASREVAASPADVFAALVDPKALAVWLPPEGMTGRFEHADIRPGGSYRFALFYPDAGRGKSTADSDVVEVRILEVDDGSRIVQAVDFDSEDEAYAGTMTMTWEVEPAAAGSLVTITAEDVPAGISAEDHAVGLASSLANLAAYVEGRG